MSTNENSGPGSRQAGGQPSGLMYVEVDYPLDQLGEFHDWYNNEHIPERVGIPGIVSGRRYASIEGGPRWLAVYELDSPAVMETDAYLHYKGPGETVWTRRMQLPNRPGFRRTIYELLWSDGSQPREPAPAGPPGLFSLRLTGRANGDDPTLRALLACPGIGRARLYRDVSDPTEHLFLADLSGLWAVQSPEFRQAWSQLAARLAERSVAYARGVQVLIL